MVKRFMWDQKNINDQSVTNSKLKVLRCDQNNLKGPIYHKPQT